MYINFGNIEAYVLRIGKLGFAMFAIPENA